MRCPACGTEIASPGSFCEVCGAQLPMQDSSPQDAQTQANPYVERPQSSSTMPNAPYQNPQNQPSTAPFVLAIIALVTAVLGLFPISIILAIIALVLNSGQKKRGEVSTKQTPTFVMGLISLILSIVMLIVAIVLGGAIWAAIMTGALDSRDVMGGTTTMSSSTKSPSSSSSKSSSASSKSSKSSSSKSSSSSSSSKSSSAKSQSSADSFSTSERPSLADFQWITPEAVAGTVPSGSTRIANFDDIVGGWKAYSYGSGMERFFNVEMSGTNSKATMTCDWYMAYDGANGQSHSDDTPDTTFSGAYGNGILELSSASGRFDAMVFWQDSTHQYATGTFMWPDGATDTIVLVRP